MAIHIKKANRGKFTAAAKRAGMGVQAYARKILANKEHHSPQLVKRANFARNASKWKHEDGGMLDPQMFGSIASGVAGIGSGFIDMFANPDDINYDRYSDINEGAAAGKGALSGAATGASAGMVLGPIGGLVGGAIGGITGAIFGNSKAKKQEEELNAAYNKRLSTGRARSRIMNMPESPTYMPVAKQGGYTIYKGQTHKGPDGGILTDEFGNPTGLSMGTPIALTEDKEVAVYMPSNNNSNEGDTAGSTYIFSDSLGFAKSATRLVNKYKLNKPNSLLYSQYKNDPLTKASIDKQRDNLIDAQEFAKETKTDSEESIEMAKGGYLSMAKAKLMLKEGVANGKRLTPKQKRYFGWIAGGKMEDGGTLPTYEGDEPWPSYLDVRARNAAEEKKARKLWRTFGRTESDIVTPTPGLFPGIPYNWDIPGTTPLDISAGQPITRTAPINAPTNLGSGRKPHGLESGIVNTQWDAYNINTPRVAPLLDASKLASKPTPITAINSTATTSSESYDPLLNPAGHLLSAVGNLADYAAMKKAKPTDIKLPRVGAQRIDLSRQRLINERNAAAARSTNVATARSLGTNAGSTFSNIAASNTGVSRLLGEQNMQSLLAEETTNAQMQQEADMLNTQMAGEENVMNTQQQNAYRAAMARLNPTGNIARTAASYFADNAAYGQGYDTLRMLAPNAELYGDDNTFIDRFKRPKVRLRD